MKACEEKMPGLFGEALSVERVIKENLRGLSYGG